MKNPLPQLKGFVRTQAKPAVTVAVPIKTPLIAGHDFPILAYWHYGLGKSVAFTSDADSKRRDSSRSTGTRPDQHGSAAPWRRRAACR